MNELGSDTIGSKLCYEVIHSVPYNNGGVYSFQSDDSDLLFE